MHPHPPTADSSCLIWRLYNPICHWDIKARVDFSASYCALGRFTLRGQESLAISGRLPHCSLSLSRRSTMQATVIASQMLESLSSFVQGHLRNGNNPIAMAADSRPTPEQPSWIVTLPYRYCGKCTDALERWCEPMQPHSNGWRNVFDPDFRYTTDPNHYLPESNGSAAQFPSWSWTGWRGGRLR